jgi:hypothetical protein
MEEIPSEPPSGLSDSHGMASLTAITLSFGCVPVTSFVCRQTLIHDDSQYEITFAGRRGEDVNTVNYGTLERILVCDLGLEDIWGSLKGGTQILALITPWKTEGEDAALVVTHYERELAPIITDIRNICGVVGRVLSRGKWGIVDRNAGLARGTFVTDEEGSDSDVSGDEE